MRNVHEQTIPFWRDGVQRPERAPLTADTHAAVAVIGAGIAGLSTAYALAREGVPVVVIDSGQVGSDMTERTSAHLSNAVDDRFAKIERRHGAGAARISAESHSAAIDFIAVAVERENIDCAFERVDGFLFAGAGRSSHSLERELEAARRAGLDDAQWADRAPIADFDNRTLPAFPPGRRSFTGCVT
jgi:glycine/D-amino acid oxidase-like deaminating enzyme